MRINNGDGFEHHTIDEEEITIRLIRLRKQGKIMDWMLHQNPVSGTTWEVRLPAYGSSLAMTTAETVAFLLGSTL